MSHSTSVVEELERAFISGAPEKRTDILLRVTDLFLTAPAKLTHDQARLFDDIINRLVTHLERRALAALSMRLACNANGPAQAIQRLASHEEIEIAGPLLAHSDALSDQNLVAIAESKSQQHLSKIAERSKLSPTVTNVIVERGDRNVVHKVAANHGASFSRFGMSTLVLRSDGDDKLIKTIAARSDISPFVFSQLVNYATEKARDHLLASAKPELRAALTRVVRQVSERMTSLALTANDWAAAQRVVNSFSQDTELTKAKVLQFANRKKVAETVIALSVLSKIPADLICELVCDQYGFGAMVLCKAINLDWYTSRAVLTINPPAATSRETELEELEEDFFRMSVSSAQRILWYWRGRVTVTSDGPRTAALSGG
jgi:uncharacterized protein (DUF2336 family)